MYDVLFKLSFFPFFIGNTKCVCSCKDALFGAIIGILVLIIILLIVYVVWLHNKGKAILFSQCTILKTLCLLKEKLAKLFKIVTSNLFQSSPSSVILVPFGQIWCFSSLANHYLKYRDVPPLTIYLKLCLTISSLFS